MGFFLPFNTFAVSFASHATMVSSLTAFSSRSNRFYIYILFSWSLERFVCVCVWTSECFYSSRIRTLTHQVININIAYLFMFSQFDFLLLLFCWLTAHTLSRTSAIWIKSKFMCKLWLLVAWRMMHKNHLKIYLTREKLLAQFIHMCELNSSSPSLLPFVVVAMSSADWYFSFPTNFDLYFFFCSYFSIYLYCCWCYSLVSSSSFENF